MHQPSAPSPEHDPAPRRRLLKRGLLALVLGLLCMLAPDGARHAPRLAGAAQVLFHLGVALAVVGVVLVALHALLRHKAVRAWADTQIGTLFPSTVVPHWDAQLFDRVGWRELGAVCATLLRAQGLRVRPVSDDEHGHVDLYLLAAGGARAEEMVRCKHWHPRAVDELELMRFEAELNAQRLARGAYVTSSSFTPQALAFAQAQGLRTIERTALMEWIGEQAEEVQQAILEIASGVPDPAAARSPSPSPSPSPARGLG